ncbi:MAG: RHS repeat-associated core domain-containing protein, partial [Bacteroidetes bacterium]|nr:RHS repeat-associated core domain-containing protein [Bacteroidota bacterium]
ALYNGNISGIAWSNSLGLSTTKQNAYVYTYDPMNRIQSSSFKEKAATWTAPANAAFAETGYQYDLNGNITALQRNDRRVSGWMDNLVYNYTGSGNQLRNVKDNGDVNAGFIDGNPSATSDDYAYDANGNMVTDKNKLLTASNAIQYNHLNLPSIVTKNTGEYIKYTYDATGRKLKQEVYNASNAVTKTTDYAGEYIYENNVLQFVNHEEGRIVTTGASPEYQYNLKDHLGNVRLTFTSKVDVVAETGTLEDANATTEQSQFLRYANAKRVYATILDKTNGASIGFAERLNGGTNEIYGLAKSLSVMPGDVINIEVYAKYIDPNSSNWTGTLSTLMSQIASNTAGVVFTDATGYANSTSSFNASYPGLLGTKTDNGAPKAYLNWLVFDRNYVSLTGGFKQITTAGKEAGTDVAHELVNSPTINITDAGYVYIWLSNENTTPVEVYFDDFKVTQTKSPVVATNDYYAFGLTFNPYTRENSTQQNYLYNGKELQDELNLGWLDYGARMYMPEIGRWNSIDPKGDKYSFATPYNYVLNNPIKSIDPDGKDVIIMIALARGSGYGHVSTLVQDGNGNWYYMVQGALNREGSPLKMLFGVSGGMELRPLGTKDRDEALEIALNDTDYGPHQDYIEFHTSPEMDQKIYEAGEALADRMMSGKKKYHLLFNNCVDAMQVPIEKGTGVKLPKDVTPKPTKYYMKLKANQQKIQRMIFDAIQRANKKEEREQRRREKEEKKKKEKEESKD